MEVSSRLAVLCVAVWCLCAGSGIMAINHWMLRDNGRITHKIDSQFYMREPENLPSFLQQIQISDFVESSYVRLLRQREQIVDHLRFSVKFGEDLMEQAKCAMTYYMQEKHTSYLKFSPAYLRRLQLGDVTLSSAPAAPATVMPDCASHAPLPIGPCSYDHLASLRPGAPIAARMEREEEMPIAGIELSDTLEFLRRLAVNALKQEPTAWRSHTLASYYWLMRGEARSALACARIGVTLAPRAVKDIALLSLGVVLTRTGHLGDADVILSAAVEHAADVAENHMVLASALAMKHDFNRSLHHFDEAERLDPSLLPRTQAVRNFITCLENLTKKTTKMNNYVEYMKSELKDFKRLKLEISQHHEKLMQQQVPLNTRDLGEQRDELLKRGQYCSTRTLAVEPVLFCDYYSDIQMRLESKEVDIDALERDLKLTSEAVMKQVRKQLNFEQSASSSAPLPPSATSNAHAEAMDKLKDK